MAVVAADAHEHSDVVQEARRGQAVADAQFGHVAHEQHAADDLTALEHRDAPVHERDVGWKGARDKGVARAEGREYIVKDGDVMLFRFNV